MKKISVLILSSLIFLSCNLGAYWFVTGEYPDDRSQTIQVLPDQNVSSNKKYTVLVMTDIHFGSGRRDRNDEAFIEDFKKLLSDSDETQLPRFMICLGDALDGGHQEEADNYNSFIEKVRQIAVNAGISDFKTYTILGNHDLYHYGWDVWKKNIYPYTSYYTLKTNADSAYEGFSWYFIDSANGTLGKAQLEDLEKNLASDTRPKIILSHYPVHCDGLSILSLQDPMEKNRLISAFAKNNVKVVFEGHAHQSTLYDNSSFEERIIPSFLMHRTYCLVTIDEETESVYHRLRAYE